jgi:hypothetical protein
MQLHDLTFQGTAYHAIRSCLSLRLRSHTSFPVVKLPCDTNRRFAWQSRLMSMRDEQGKVGRSYLNRSGEVRIVDPPARLWLPFQISFIVLNSIPLFPKSYIQCIKLARNLETSRYRSPSAISHPNSNSLIRVTEHSTRCASPTNPKIRLRTTCMPLERHRLICDHGQEMRWQQGR